MTRRFYKIHSLISPVVVLPCCLCFALFASLFLSSSLFATSDRTPIANHLVCNSFTSFPLSLSLYSLGSFFPFYRFCFADIFIRISCFFFSFSHVNTEMRLQNVNQRHNRMRLVIFNQCREQWQRMKHWRTHWPDQYRNWTNRTIEIDEINNSSSLCLVAATLQQKTNAHFPKHW